MFSARLRWDLHPNPIAQLLAQKRSAGAEVLDLTESNPTRAGIAYPVNEIAAAFADPAILRYDPQPLGIRTVREAVSRYYGGAVEASRILLTTSTSEAYAFLFKLLTYPGDRILVPRPSYPLFEFLAGLEMVEVEHYPLVYHGRWEIDFDALERSIGPGARAIVVVNPNNPTGSFLHRRELDRLIELCAARGLAIISDQVFSAYGLGDDPGCVPSLHQVQEVPVFCLDGLSKMAGLPQMKLAWIAVNGPAGLRDESMARLELIADTYLSVGAPVQAAAPTLLRLAPGIRDQISRRTARNLQALRQAIGPESPFRVLSVEGGWYAVLQAPRIRGEEEWVLHLLNRENVLTQPGFYYDFASEAFLVLSLLTPELVFDPGVARLLSCQTGSST